MNELKIGTEFVYAGGEYRVIATQHNEFEVLDGLKDTATVKRIDYGTGRGKIATWLTQTILIFLSDPEYYR